MNDRTALGPITRPVADSKPECDHASGSIASSRQFPKPEFGNRFRRPHLAVGTAVALLPMSMLFAGHAKGQELDSFAILAGSGITNTGPTTINGNIGSSPTGSYTGSGSVSQTGSVYLADAVAARVQNDLTTLYNVLAARPTSPGGNLTGVNLDGQNLLPGVYNFDTSAGLASNGVLTLNGGGDPDAVFIFNIGSTLTVGSFAEIRLENAAQGGNVFFRVGSSATLNPSADFVGQIVAMTSIILETSADIECGAALARNGAVTMDSNTIGICVLDSASFVDSLDDMDDSTTTSGNAGTVADALDAYETGGGILPASFTILAASLTPEELTAALALLAGETATGVSPSGMRAMDSLLDALLDHRTFPSSSPGQQDTSSGPGTVSVLGYAKEEESAGAQPFASAAPKAPPRSWSVWAGGYGGYAETDGDVATGAHERTSRDYGVAFGVDYYLDNRTTLGIAFAKGWTGFDIGEFGSGDSDTYHVALHVRTESDVAYVAGAVAYGYNDVSTDRTVMIGGTDRFVADFGAQNVAGHIEAGYRLGWITPYAALRGQVFMTPAYSEVTVAGVSTYALDYQSRTATSLRSELGAGVEWSQDNAGDGTLTLRARAAWVHEYMSDTGVAAQFQSLAGAGFTVVGAEPDADSIQLSAGAELGLPGGMFLASSIGGRFGAHAQSYSGNIKLGYDW